jgi:hypothetical protein
MFDQAQDWVLGFVMGPRKRSLDLDDAEYHPEVKGFQQSIEDLQTENRRLRDEIAWWKSKNQVLQEALARRIKIMGT